MQYLAYSVFLHIYDERGDLMMLFAFAPHETLPEKILIIALLLVPVLFGIRYLRERWKEEYGNTCDDGSENAQQE